MSPSSFSLPINGCINYLLLGNNGTVHRRKQQQQQALGEDRVLSQLISAAAGAASRQKSKDECGYWKTLTCPGGDLKVNVYHMGTYSYFFVVSENV